MKETNRIVTQNIAKVEINIMSEWLREYEERVTKFKRIITCLTTFVNIPTS